MAGSQQAPPARLEHRKEASIGVKRPSYITVRPTCGTGMVTAFALDPSERELLVEQRQSLVSEKTLAFEEIERA